MDAKILVTWEQVTGHVTVRQQIEAASQARAPEHASYLLDMAVAFYRKRLEGILHSWHSRLLLTDETISGPADLDIPEIRRMVNEVDLDGLIDNIAEADEAVRHGMDFLDRRYGTHVERFDAANFDLGDGDYCVLAQAAAMTWEDAMESLGLQYWLPETCEKMINLGFTAETNEMEEIVSQLWLRAYEQRKA